MNEKFCRQEAIKLACTTSSHLAYLDRIGLVVPEKIGSVKKPYCFYTAEQIKLIQQVNLLSQYFNIPTVRKFADGEEPYKSAMMKFLESIDTLILR